MPFGLTILCGWLVGFMAGWADDQEAMLRAWMTISLVSSLILFSLYRLDPQRRWKAVAALAVAMLALDVLYSWLRWQGVPVGGQYSKALDAGLIAQLVLIGYRGAWNALVLLWSRVPVFIRGRRVAVKPSHARKKEAAE